MVALGVHDRERVTAGDRLGPGDGVRVGVVLGDRVVRLVEQGEAHLGEVHEFDVERVGGLGHLLEPCGDRTGGWAEGPGAGQ